MAMLPQEGMNWLQGFFVLIHIFTGMTGCDRDGEISLAEPDPHEIIHMRKGDTVDFKVDGTAPVFSRYAWYRDDPYASKLVSKNKNFSCALTELTTNRAIISCKLQESWSGKTHSLPQADICLDTQ